MQLNHFTTPENALLIGLGNGLEPHVTKADGAGHGIQTMGVPVVWLTKEENNLATAEHLAHLQKLGVISKTKIGEPLYGGPVCCTVEVERTRHLMRWVEFLRTTRIEAIDQVTGERITGRDVLRSYDMMPHVDAQWWISTRAIPANRVWVALTRAQGIEGCDWHIKTHPDAEGRERWAAQRDSFAALDAETLIVLHDCKGQLLERKAA
jgi:hypothetical protein